MLQTNLVVVVIIEIQAAVLYILTHESLKDTVPALSVITKAATFTMQ